MPLPSASRLFCFLSFRSKSRIQETSSSAAYRVLAGEGNSKIKQKKRLLRAQINEENRGRVQCNCKQEMVCSTNAMALCVCFILLVLKYVWRDEGRYLLKKLSAPDWVNGLQWPKTTWISNFYSGWVSLLTPWHHILCKPWPTFIYSTLSLCPHCIVIKIFMQKLLYFLYKYISMLFNTKLILFILYFIFKNYLIFISIQFTIQPLQCIFIFYLVSFSNTCSLVNLQFRLHFKSNGYI